MKITILGARGSVPVNGRDMQEFGGATSCVLVETPDQAIFLDAGTGIIRTPDIGDKHISILLTHPHIDHLVGLPFFPYVNESGRAVDIYAKRRGAFGAAEQIDRFISPPLWPCIVTDYPAVLNPIDLMLPLKLGDVTVTGIESEHPGGSIVFKLSCEGKSLVYATDYECYETKLPALIDFVRDCDLLMYDGQYTEEELIKNRGFGHSTISSGMRVKEEGNVRAVRFVHHDPRHTDEQLRAMEETVKGDGVAFAREGEVLEL